MIRGARTLSVKHAQDVLHIGIQLRAQRVVALGALGQLVHAPQRICRTASGLGLISCFFSSECMVYSSQAWGNVC